MIVVEGKSDGIDFFNHTQIVWGDVVKCYFGHDGLDCVSNCVVEFIILNSIAQY